MPGRTKAGYVHFFIRLVLSPVETTLRHVIRISDACRHLRRRCAPLQRGQTWAVDVRSHVERAITAPPLLLPTASEAAMNAIRSLALILTPTPTS